MLARLACKVAVSAAAYAIDKPYEYIIPESMAPKIEIGMRAVVPFGKGNKKCEAVILSIHKDEGTRKLKALLSLMEEQPLLSNKQIKLALWMRDRFFCTVYDAIHAMLPSGMWYRDSGKMVKSKTEAYLSLAIAPEDALVIAEQKKMRAPLQSSVLRLLSTIGEAPMKEIIYFTGASAQTIKTLINQDLLSREEIEVYRRPKYETGGIAEDIVLNDEQQKAYEKLTYQIKNNVPSAALLFGITGSGKTSVYINLIKDVIAEGKTAIVLVPEIALTPQLLNIFSSHFGDEIAVLHSSLGIGERYDEWKRIKNGMVKVVIGTRSAVFAPIDNLGLIIMDEEQEYTYKSENSPRYHARDIAKYRCAQEGAVLLLGSATPSVESMYSAQSGVYSLYELKKRYNVRAMPEVKIADMRKELKAGNGTYISSVLQAEIQKNIENGEQCILFINRRGASSQVICGECGYVYTCGRCSVNMTYHTANGRLMCHHCGYSTAIDGYCPECGAKLKYIGAGTQKIEEQLHELFPDTEILRMDTDTVSPMHSHEAILSKFKNEKVPILIGTQMVTKGLDFENVTLVGVVMADQMLYAGNFRAYERTFSLITQSVGRSGRGSKAGRAVIQTFTPENEIIRLSSMQDYMQFYNGEIEVRRALRLPPFCDIFRITVSGIDETNVIRASTKVCNSLERYLNDIEDIKVLGPAPASVMKVNNRYRYQISVSAQNSKRIRDTISHVIREFSKDKTNRGLTIFADVNPID